MLTSPAGGWISLTVNLEGLCSWTPDVRVAVKGTFLVLFAVLVTDDGLLGLGLTEECVMVLESPELTVDCEKLAAMVGLVLLLVGALVALMLLVVRTFLPTV